MMSKTIAGRVMGACSHTIPVHVPCSECVEKQLVSWEQRIRDEAKAQLTDEMKQGREAVAGWKAEVDRVKRGNEMLLDTVKTLRAANSALSAKLNDAKRDADGLRAQIHADQAAKSYPRLQTVSE